MKHAKPFTVAVLYTGLLAGTADILAAVVSSWFRSGGFPSGILHYIAGGALGLEKSMKGGVGIAALGLFIHYFIACCWTLLFFLTLSKAAIFKRHRYAVGLGYGILVGVCMTFVVLPTTALPDAPFDFQNALVSWAILGVFLGIPIAYGVHRWDPAQKTLPGKAD